MSFDFFTYIYRLFIIYSLDVNSGFIRPRDGKSVNMPNHVYNHWFDSKLKESTCCVGKRLNQLLHLFACQQYLGLDIIPSYDEPDPLPWNWRVRTYSYQEEWRTYKTNAQYIIYGFLSEACQHKNNDYQPIESIVLLYLGCDN